MKISDFAKKHNISAKKARAMAPYIPMARQCSYCRKWDIPEDAKPIYIAHKQKYGVAKKYGCVLDAIAFDMQIHENFSRVTLVECQTIVPQLRDKGLIVLKHGCPASSVNYTDYMISFSLAEEWRNKDLQHKTELVIETLKTIQELAKLGTTIAAVAMQ